MAEGARLESVFRGNSNVGSNPTLSARSYLPYNKLVTVYPDILIQLRVQDTYMPVSMLECAHLQNGGGHAHDLP